MQEGAEEVCRGSKSEVRRRDRAATTLHNLLSAASGSMASMAWLLASCCLSHAAMPAAPCWAAIAVPGTAWGRGESAAYATAGAMAERVGSCAGVWGP